MRQAPSQLALAAPHLHHHHHQDEEDGAAHHLAQPGEVPAHHDLGGVREERQDVRSALRVLQGHLQDRSVAVATYLIIKIVIIMIDDDEFNIIFVFNSKHLRAIFDDESAETILVLDDVLDPSEAAVALEQVARQVDRPQGGDVRLEIVQF